MEAKLKIFRKQNKEDASHSKLRYIGVKLPEIKIKSFDGDVINWNPFLEAFNATIDMRDDLSNVE